MKATGIVRKIDDLGRLVIPKELRETMDLNIKDPMEIYVDEDKIILKKYNPGCVFCGNVEDVVEYKGKYVCSNCLDKLMIEQKEA